MILESNGEVMSNLALSVDSAPPPRLRRGSFKKLDGQGKRNELRIGDP